MTPAIFKCGFSGKNDKTLFPCAYSEWDEKRISSIFWDDFSIADAYGVSGVQDTYNRAFESWKNNYKMLTELVGILNHKIWFWYKKNDELAKLYDKLWKSASCYAQDHLEGDELKFFYYVLD